jgi:hypothetical protein
MVSGAISIAKSVYQALDFFRGVAGSGVIAAYFRHDGTRVYGSDRIEIDVIRDEKRNTVWWYSVKSLEDYVFIRVPVVESCAYELAGHVVGEPVPDARFWRWVAPVLPGRIYGSTQPENVMVDFLVFGYRPKALIKYFST